MKTGRLNRRNAGRLVLLAWAGSLAWLARRELGKREGDVIAEASILLSPESHFFAVRAGDRQIGFARIAVDTLTTALRLTEVLALDVPEADSTRRMTRTTEINLSRSLRLRSFNATLAGGGVYQRLEGLAVGDTVLQLIERETRDGPVATWSLPFHGDLVLPQVLPYRLALSRRLITKRVMTAKVLDPSTGQVEAMELSATAESTFVVPDSAVWSRVKKQWIPVTWDTVLAWRLEHRVNGTPTVSWVDGHGSLVRSETPLGVLLQRSGFELVTLNYRAEQVVADSAVRRVTPGMQGLLESGRVPDTGGVREFVVGGGFIDRFPESRVEWLTGGRQRLSGTLVRIVAGGVDATEGGGGDSASSGLPVPELTWGEPASARLRAQAGRIVGQASDPEERVRRLTRWVATAVARDTARGSSTRPEVVLDSHRGGAEAHARLLVALAQALGIPARTVIGVAVLPPEAYGHAWTEVWVGRWEAADPTFGQFPASPALLRLAARGRALPIDLVPLVGSARFVTAEPPATR